ncbi:MAG: hypothetical protein AUK31_05245 [Fibrobacteres bacterium CG2_30_45_31]|nr:MAG: hypothetical protein AUK31_05245 [Fibrobacteres bacterium CG2_30_45_31]
MFGYYRAKHTKAWYEDLNSGINYVGSDSLLNEVLTFFDDSLDYCHYDFEGDSYADAINIVYVGTPKAWAKGLWPHAGHVGQVKDSILLVRYEMTNLASTFSLGTFVHESGHMIFGWPDLYYFGDYCAMGSGTANSPKAPVSPNDFFRADQGWIPLNDVSSTIFSAETTNSSNGYIFKNPSNSDEGYFWSYVKGGWKRWSYLSGSMGLLVFHYNLAEQGNSSPEHLRLRVIEADGGNELLASMVPEPGHAYDLFNEYTQSTLINPLWYDNTESGLRITQIGNPAGTITFTMEGPGSSSSSTTISSSSGTTMILKNEAMGASNFDHRSERFDLLGRNNQQRQD